MHLARILSCRYEWLAGISRVIRTPGIRCLHMSEKRERILLGIRYGLIIESGFLTCVPLGFVHGFARMQKIYASMRVSKGVDDEKIDSFAG